MIAVAVLLTGVWLIVDSQEVPSDTLTLIFGLVIAALAFFELLPSLRSRV